MGARTACVCVLLFFTSATSIAQTKPSSPATKPSGATLSSADEIHALMEAGKYQDALKAVNLVLGRSDVAAAGYNKWNLLECKTECQLQTRDRAGALGTLNKMAHDADQGGAINDKAFAVGMTLIVQKAHDFKYAPVTASDKTPIDLLDRTARPHAFQCLFDDQLALLQQKKTNSKADEDLKPIVDIANDFRQVQAAEIMATGAHSKTDAESDELTSWASELVSQTFQTFLGEIRNARADANQKIPKDEIMPNGRRRTIKVPKGLDDSEIQTLQHIRSYCNSVPSNLATINRSFVHPLELKSGTVGNRATALKNAAEALLNGNFRIRPEDVR